MLLSSLTVYRSTFEFPRQLFGEYYTGHTGLQKYQSSLASHSRNSAVGVNPLRNSLTIWSDYLSNKVSDSHLRLTLASCGSK